MKLSDVPSQYLFFYNLKWEFAMDELLLRRVLQMEDECFPIPAYQFMHALTTAMIAINKKFEKSLSLSEVKKRMEFLEKRYNTFKKLTRTKQTRWVLESNEIVAASEVWETIITENFFAGAYLREGEPEYYTMCLLFGKTDIKKEPSHTVILISDSPNPTISHTLQIISSSPDEEVNPSAAHRPSQAVRKLFADDAMSCVAPMPTVDNVGSNPRPKLVSRMPPTGWRKRRGGKTTNVEESSCASSSPRK